MQGWVLAVATLALSTFAFADPSVPATEGADVALVRAVDVSSSVDDARFALQREGIAEGLKNPAVLDAITGGPSRRSNWRSSNGASSSRCCLIGK